MKVHWRRLLLGTAVAEAVPIGTLILLVAAMGPRDPEEARIFATALGRWVGPLGGAVMATVMALWVARGLRYGHVLNGFLLGLLLAILDVLLLVASRQPFAWIFAASNLGKIAAGTLGGVVAARRPAVGR